MVTVTPVAPSNATLPVLAMMLPPKLPIVVPAVTAIALPPRLTASLSLRPIELPAVNCRFPAAVIALVAMEPPPSLTFKSIAPEAARTRAPEVLVIKSEVDLIRMSRPEVMLMAATLSARPALVVCNEPFKLMSNAPRVTRRIVPMLVKLPMLKLPKLRVKSTLPVGLNVPPVWLKSKLTVKLPAPLTEPDDRFNTGAENKPLMPRLPPAMVMFSSDIKSARLKVPAVMVMVCRPATLMRTRCPAVGAVPVLQLAPTDQSPLVPIQQSSTTQPELVANDADVAP